MSVTLQQTQAAMEELIIPGKVPNGKVAFWNAALSALNELGRNCAQAAVMRTYANRPLPLNREELWKELGSCLFHSHINALYEIEKLWNAGVIHFNAGYTLESQLAWRRSMVAAIPGMSYKTVSFALHIYDYEHCLILTIDRHHLKRLGFKRSSCSTPKQYLDMEKRLYALIDSLQAHEPGYMPLVYAAYLWENWRQEHGASRENGTYQSHAGLSCYC